VERPQVRRTLDLDCSPAVLWDLISEAVPLSTWLGREVVIDLRPGGSGRLVEDDDGVRELLVREVVPEERLVFSWWPSGDDQAASDVVFSLEPAGEGSRLVVTETCGAATSWDIRLVSLWLSVCALARV
jgi:uncharacterized protein YndB with AHSA1/START domain